MSRVFTQIAGAVTGALLLSGRTTTASTQTSSLQSSSAAASVSARSHPSPHRLRRVAVTPDLKLEVVDLRNELSTVSIAITHVTVIDVSTGQRLIDRTVLVQGNRIARVERGAAVVVPSGARVVDGRGRYLIPGLWDMHVHVGDPGLAVRFSLPLLVANGVTGVRDMGSPLDSILLLRRRIRTDSVLGPRLVVAGPALAGRPPWGGAAAAHLWWVETPTQARAAVDSLGRAGVDFIKVHDFLTRDVYRAIAEEAARLHLPLAGHLRATVGPVEASDAGQASIEHLAPEFAAYCAPGGEARARAFYDGWIKGFAPAYEQGVLTMRRTREVRTCAGVLARLRRNGSRVDPTLVLRRQDSSFYARPAAAYLMPAMKALCDATITYWATPGRALSDAFYRDMETQVGEMHRAGVRLLVGTDAGSACLVPGFSLHDELALLVKSGLSPLEALRTATFEPTRFLGISDSLGTIAPGQLGDLVLLDGDPLVDIRNARKIVAVLANGRLLDRAALYALLGSARATARTGPPAP